MFELLTEFRNVYVTAQDAVEDPDPRLVALDELLTRLLAVATAAQQMHVELEAQTECPHCKAHAIAGTKAHADECVTEPLCSALADLALFNAKDGAGSPTVLDQREGELLSTDDVALLALLVGGVDVFSPGKAHQIRGLARRRPGLIDIGEAMGKYDAKDIHPFFGAILTDEGRAVLAQHNERITVRLAGRAALARPCALELDEVAGG